MNSIKRLEYHQCRTCYDCTDNLQLLTSFAQTGVNPADAKTYVQLVLEVCNINIMDDEPSDEWPQFICVNCSNKLILAHDFIQHSVKINKFLKSLADIFNSASRVDFLQKPELDIPLEIKMENDDDVEILSSEREFLYSPIEAEMLKVTPSITTYERSDNILCNNYTSYEQNTNNKIIENVNGHIKEIIMPSTIEFISDDEMNTDKNNTINKKRSKKSKSNSTCLQCNKLFRSPWHLRRHLSCVHVSEENKICCTKCDEKFVRIEQFKKHMESVHKVKGTQPNNINKKNIPCNECNKVFNSYTQIIRHKRFVHVPEEKKKVCHICHRKFARTDSYKRHMIRVHGIELIARKSNLVEMKTTEFFCDECDRRYTQRYRLNKHKSEVHGH